MCRLWQALTVAVSVFAFSAEPAFAFAKKQSGASSSDPSPKVRVLYSHHPVRASDTILPPRANCQSEAAEANCSCYPWQEPVWAEDELRCRTSSAVYNEQEAGALEVRVAIDAEEGYHGTLRFDVFDREDRNVSDPYFASVSLNIGAPKELLVPISLNRMGTHRLRMTEVGSGASSDVMEFAVIPKRVQEIARDIDSPFGGVLDPSRPEFSFQLGRRIGMRWVRSPEWTSFDLELANLNQMNVVGPWQADSDQQLLHWDATSDEAQAEMDAADYVTQCRTAYLGAKEQNSNAQVVASAEADPDWIEEALAAGLNGCADVLSLRDSSSDSIELTLFQLRAGINGIGDKPVWISTENFADAEGLTKYFVKTLAAGVKKIFVPASSLVKESGGLQEHAVAYATLADRLSGKTFDRKISLDWGTHVYLFKGESEILAAYWDEQGSVRGVRPVYFSGAQTPEFSGVDLMNNETHLSPEKGALLVSDAPRLLLFRDSSPAEVSNWLSYASFIAPQAPPRPPLAHSGGSQGTGTSSNFGTNGSGKDNSDSLLSSTWNAATSFFSQRGGQIPSDAMQVIGSDGEDQERFPAEFAEFNNQQTMNHALPIQTPPQFPVLPGEQNSGEATPAAAGTPAAQAQASAPAPGQPGVQAVTQASAQNAGLKRFAPPRFVLASAQNEFRTNMRVAGNRPTHARNSYQSPIDLYEAEIQASDRANAATSLDFSTGGGWAFVIVMLVLAGVPLWFLPRSF